MKVDIAYSYIYDFLSVLFENNDIHAHIQNILLFGSIARGKFDKKSDIDIFFDIKNESYKELLEKTLKNSLKSFELRASKTWGLKGVDFPINCIAGDLDAQQWKSLREDIVSNGISLLGKFELMPEKVSHYALFYFSLEKLKRKDKMKFLRKLFGYKNVKMKKTYLHKGRLERIGGIKIGPNNILIPLAEVESIKDIFKSFSITPKIIEVWLRE